MQLGRYEVIRKLGEGGMARVLLAKSANGERVVLKVPFTENADFAERVRDEARVGLRAHHPSLVDTLDLFEHEGKPILVVEYVEGASLQQIRREGGPMPPGLVARIGRQVAEGLAFLHEATDENEQPLNILHRDVTPGNILVTPEGNAKLIDLGIARGAETKATKTEVGTVRGTVRYLAPELLMGEPHSPATDLWALGVVLFEAALGRRAAEGDEREVLAAITRGAISQLRPGESLDEGLRDGLFALLAPREGRLQRARAAVNVWKRVEQPLPVDEAWCRGVVEAVLARMRARWDAETAALVNAPTLVSAPSAPLPQTEDEREGADTAVAQPAVVGDVPSAAATHEEPSPRPALSDPRPHVAPDEELAHLDGIAPTIQMEAAEFIGLAPGAPTEQMPAVTPSALASADTQLGAPSQSFEQTERFPKPGPAASLGFGQTERFPKPGPASSLPFEDTERFPVPGSSGSLAPDEKTEAGAPPPRPPSGWPAAPDEPPRLATHVSREISGPLPRMLRVEEAFRNDTDVAQPALSLSPVASTEPDAPPEGVPGGDPPPAPQKPVDPSHRPPDRSVLGIPTQPAFEAAAVSALGSSALVPEESTETAFPISRPEPPPPPVAFTPPAPLAPPAPAMPPAGLESLDESDRTMRVPPAPRAGFVGQQANPEDATERVPRVRTVEGTAQGALRVEDPLLSGELEWRPKRTKHLAIGAAVALAVAVATVVVLLLAS